MTTLTKQHACGAGYQAAIFIYSNGKIQFTQAELLVNVDFGSSPRHRYMALSRAIETGWLMKSASGEIYITRQAVEYLDGVEQPAKKYIGQKAAPRDMGSAYDRPALSKKYLTNSRGDHVRVIDDRFQRAEGARFHSVPTGAV